MTPPPLCGATTALTDAEIVEMVRRIMRPGSGLEDEPFWSLRLESACDLWAGHEPAPHASLQTLPSRDGVQQAWLRWDAWKRVITWVPTCPFVGDDPSLSECLLYDGHPDQHHLWDEKTRDTAPSWIRCDLPADFGTTPK